jgi:hypothetical protein
MSHLAVREAGGNWEGEANAREARYFSTAWHTECPSSYCDEYRAALNHAVILQFLEQSLHGGLYHHDRRDGKYHAP